MPYYERVDICINCKLSETFHKRFGQRFSFSLQVGTTLHAKQIGEWLNIVAEKCIILQSSTSTHSGYSSLTSNHHIWCSSTPALILSSCAGLSRAVTHPSVQSPHAFKYLPQPSSLQLDWPATLGRLRQTRGTHASSCSSGRMPPPFIYRTTGGKALKLRSIYSRTDFNRANRLRGRFNQCTRSSPKIKPPNIVNKALYHQD